MYIPAHFEITEPDALHRIIQDNPLGILVTGGQGGLDANHIPFLFNPSEGTAGTLIAHVARANPVWQQCAQGCDAMVIFRGAAGYISPNWYPSKHETHRHVPTWNYEVVHAHGRLVVRDDEKFLREVVGRLTKTHEAKEPSPWKMSDSSPEYIDGMLKAIMGIEILVTRLEGKAKLSQNREIRDRQGAIHALRRLENDVLAQAMEKHAAS
jgi:transcriptional regulator